MIKTSTGQEFSSIQEMRATVAVLKRIRETDYAARTVEIENLELEISKVNTPLRVVT